MLILCRHTMPRHVFRRAAHAMRAIDDDAKFFHAAPPRRRGHERRFRDASSLMSLR